MGLEDLDRLANDILDERARATEYLTDRELFDRCAADLAAFHTLADCWLVAHLDDPRMPEYLIEEEQCSEDLVDAVLARMRGLGARNANCCSPAAP